MRLFLKAALALGALASISSASAEVGDGGAFWQLPDYGYDSLQSAEANGRT